MSSCTSLINFVLNARPFGPANIASMLAPMLYVATVNEKPPGVEARAATGGALLLAALLLAMAAAPACRAADVAETQLRRRRLATCGQVGPSVDTVGTGVARWGHGGDQLWPGGDPVGTRWGPRGDQPGGGPVGTRW